MSILNKSASDTSSALVPVGADREQKAKGAGGMSLAASPRANLLPPEITENNRRRAARGWLRAIVVVVVLIAAGGVAGAWYLQNAAQQSLAEAQSETARLTAEQGRYKDVTTVLKQIELGTAAEKVGGGTDIDWATYLRRLQATLPSGVTLTSVSIQSADAQSAFTQSTTPLEGARVATLTFTASSATLPSIPQWIDGLSSLPGFADASPDNVSQTDSGYSAGVTMHIDTGAYSFRFDPDGKKAAEK